MSTLRQRVLAGLGANAFAQIVGITIQLVSVPVFLSRWDTSTYGVWLVLTAIPTYIAMAEVGMVAAAGNWMTIAMGRGHHADVNRIFHSAIVFMSGVCAIIVALGLPSIALTPLGSLDDADLRWTLAFLLLSVVLALYGGLNDAVFRATGRYARGVMLSNIEKILEWAALLCGFFFVGTFSAMAGLQFLVRLICFVLIMWVGLRGDTRIRWGISQATAAEIRELFRTGLHYMSLAMGQAMSLQGFTLIVGATLNTSAVAVFNTYRTIARVIVQATGLLSHAVAPEFAAIFGARNPSRLRALYRRTAAISGSVAVGLSFILYPLAPVMLHYWTNGAVPFESAVMALMLAYAAVAALGHVPKEFLMATTRHARLAQSSLVIAVAGLAFAAGLAHAYQLEGIVVALVGAELLLTLASIALARRVLSAPSER
jgi:O-antigen/teichoic acid export membrane protein